MPEFDFSQYKKVDQEIKKKKTPSIIPKKYPKEVNKLTQNKRDYDSITSEIDFESLANSSDFKRLIYLSLTGKSWRGSNLDLENKLNEKLEELRSK